MKKRVLFLAFLMSVVASIADGQGASARNDVNRLCVEGKRALDKGEFGTAINCSSEAIRLDPKCETAYYNRGLALSRLGDYGKAIADFSEAIRLDPKDADTCIARGVAYAGENEYDKAIADCNEAIRIEPKSAMAYLNRGWCHRTKGEYEKAIADFTDAIRVDPKLGAGYFRRAQTYQRTGEKSKAEADFAEAKRLGYQGTAGEPGRAAAMAGAAGTVDDDGRIRDIERDVQITEAQKKAMSEIIKRFDKAYQDFVEANRKQFQARSEALRLAYLAKDKDAIAKAQTELNSLLRPTRVAWMKLGCELGSVLTPAQRRVFRERRITRWIKAETAPVQLGDEQMKTIMGRCVDPTKEDGSLVTEAMGALPQVVLEVLTREQKTQIATYRARSYVNAALGRVQLSGDQTKKIAAIVDDLVKELPFDRGWPGFDAMQGELGEKIGALLSPEQLKAIKSSITRSGNTVPVSPEQRKALKSGVTLSGDINTAPVPQPKAPSAR